MRWFLFLDGAKYPLPLLSRRGPRNSSFTFKFESIVHVEYLGRLS